MVNLQWLNSMSVGVSEFDEDHRKVIALIREISAAAHRQDDKTAIDLAGDLALLAEDHIKREEAFLRSIHFPGVETVIGAQKDNLGRIFALSGRLAANPAEGADIALEMGGAFVNYLLRADINYKSYVEISGHGDARK